MDYSHLWSTFASIQRESCKVPPKGAVNASAVGATKIDESALANSLDMYMHLQHNYLYSQIALKRMSVCDYVPIHNGNVDKLKAYLHLALSACRNALAPLGRIKLASNASTEEKEGAFAI